MTISKDPLLEKGQPSRRKEWALLIFLFLAKTEIAVGNQVILFFAPFLAKDTGGMDLAGYRYSLLAFDFAALLPLFFPLEKMCPRKAGAAALLVVGLSYLAPQVLLADPHDSNAWAVPTLTFFRLVSGSAFTLFNIVCSVALSTIPEERRGTAMARVEMSWFLASFILPAFGGLLEQRGAIFAVCALMVVPSIILSAVSLFILPSETGDTNVDAGGAHGEAAAEKTSTKKGAVLRRLLGPLMWMSVAMIVNALFGVRYGQWLHVDFGLGATTVGVFSNAIGLGNLTGNFITQALSGASKSMRWSALVATFFLGVLNLAMMFMPTSSPIGAVFGIVLLYFVLFEVGFLACYAYTLEVLGEEKMVGMALFNASISLGRVFGDWLAPLPAMSVIFALSAAGYVAASASLTIPVPDAKKATKVSVVP